MTSLVGASFWRPSIQAKERVKPKDDSDGGLASQSLEEDRSDLRNSLRPTSTFCQPNLWIFLPMANDIYSSSSGLVVLPESDRCSEYSGPSITRLQSGASQQQQRCS